MHHLNASTQLQPGTNIATRACPKSGRVLKYISFLFFLRMLKEQKTSHYMSLIKSKNPKRSTSPSNLSSQSTWKLEQRTIVTASSTGSFTHSSAALAALRSTLRSRTCSSIPGNQLTIVKQKKNTQDIVERNMGLLVNITIRLNSLPSLLSMYTCSVHPRQWTQSVLWHHNSVDHKKAFIKWALFIMKN